VFMRGGRLHRRTGGLDRTADPPASHAQVCIGSSGVPGTGENPRHEGKKPNQAGLEPSRTNIPTGLCGRVCQNVCAGPKG